MVLLPPDKKGRDGIESSKMEYVEKTISAYNKNCLNYMESTRESSPLLQIKKFTELLPLGDLILDAGCASGRDTKILSDEGFKTIGIDLSCELLKYAKAFSPKSEFSQMDVRSLDFPSNHFGGIWCNATLLHLKDKDLKKSLGEFYRTIKEGGVLFVSFKEGKGSEELIDPVNKDCSKFYNYQTVNSVKSLLEEAGFKQTEVAVVNGKNKFGKDRRNINWIYAFARK